MNRRKFTAALLLLTGQFGRRARASDEDTAAEIDDIPAEGPTKAKGSTLGGKQFWGDELFFDEWHIQRNSFTGHWRLLDGRNRRFAWGTFEQCRARLEEIKHEQDLLPMRGRAVVVLHGLLRSPASMAGLVRFLREQGDYTVFNVTYPTTRGEIGQHAESLASIVKHLDGIEEINFVGHSLGNVVIRHYLADHTDAAAGKTPDPRIKRIVMLGPPNNGAQLAGTFGRSQFCKLVIGKTINELGPQWTNLQSRLATPACEFGIIAGGRGGQRGYNPWLKGDNDLVVSVETTRLAGARDFAVVPVMHTFMMDHPTVQEYTQRFLQTGCFVGPNERHPIEITSDE